MNDLRTSEQLAGGLDAGHRPRRVVPVDCFPNHGRVLSVGQVLRTVPPAAQADRVLCGVNHPAVLYRERASRSPSGTLAWRIHHQADANARRRAGRSFQDSDASYGSGPTKVPGGRAL